MKIRNILFILLGVILSINIVNAVDISIDNYYPTPVEAGDYFNVWLKISNKDNSNDVEGVSVKLKEEYPFSLDPGDDEEIIINKIEAGSFVIQKIKIRVDAGAKEGDTKISFQYKDCKGCEWKEKSMFVIVVESQTTFDVVLQELNSEGVFIALANIGKNPANAVTIRIPEQELFKTDLVSASIVGNLESGDYTLVGFQIVPKSEVQGVVPEKTKDETETRSRTFSTQEEELIVQIDYTDPLGVRRSVFKTISLNPSMLSNQFLGTDGTGMGMGTRSGQETTLLSNTWFWVSAVLIVGIASKILYKKFRKKK